jgi:hypothetical protein
MTREQALQQAFLLTIKEVGLAGLKSTSLFGSNLKIQTSKAA